MSRLERPDGEVSVARFDVLGSTLQFDVLGSTSQLLFFDVLGSTSQVGITDEGTPEKPHIVGDTLGSVHNVETFDKTAGVGEGTPDMPITGSVTDGNGFIPPSLSKRSH